MNTNTITNANANAELNGAELVQPNSTNENANAEPANANAEPANANAEPANANANGKKAAKKNGKKAAKKNGKKAEIMEITPENAEISKAIQTANNVYARLHVLTGVEKPTVYPNMESIVTVKDFSGNNVKVGVLTAELFKTVYRAKDNIAGNWKAISLALGTMQAMETYKSIKNPAKNGENFKSMKEFLMDAAQRLTDNGIEIGYETLSQYSNVGEIFYLPYSTAGNEQLFEPFQSVTPSVLTPLLGLRNVKTSNGEKIDLLRYLIAGGYFKDGFKFTQKGLKAAVSSIKAALAVPNAPQLLLEGKKPEDIKQAYDEQLAAKRAEIDERLAEKRAEIDANETPKDGKLVQPNSDKDADETPKDGKLVQPNSDKDADETPKEAENIALISPYKLDNLKHDVFSLHITSHEQALPVAFKIPATGIMTLNILEKSNPDYDFYKIGVNNRFVCYNRLTDGCFGGVLEFPDCGALNGIDLMSYTSSRAANWKEQELANLMKSPDLSMESKIVLINAVNELDDMTAYEWAEIRELQDN